MNLKQYLKKKKIIILCGSGGVGKTTLTAALALKAAQEGKKVLALTIDPAKRLADCLGVKNLDNCPQKLTTNLWAMMLDMKKTFDDLIIKYAPTKEVAQKILANRIYQHLSSALIGSQEYMAIEKLYEVYHEHQFDLIILDTPPTKHAIDFLEAPLRLSQFIDKNIIKWFIKPSLHLGQRSFKLFASASSLVFKVIERLTGLQLLLDISEFFLDFENLLDGFKDRAEAVNNLLQSDQCVFFLIASPQIISIKEAKGFQQKLKKLKFPFGGFIINKISPLFSLEKEAPFNERDPSLNEIFTLLQRNLDFFALLHQHDQKQIEILEKGLNVDEIIIKIDYLNEDLYDIKGLIKINNLINYEG